MEKRVKRMLYAHRTKNLFVVLIEQTKKLVTVENCGVTLVMGKKDFNRLFKKEGEVYSFV